MAFGNPVTFKITGVANTLKDLKNIEKAVQKRIREVLRTQLESWVVDAKMLTPVDTGALQLSGRVINPGGSLINFQIIFGDVVRKGKFVDYADEVHTNHPTGAGFLEKVVDARTPQLEAILVSELNGALNSA